LHPGYPRRHRHERRSRRKTARHIGDMQPAREKTRIVRPERIRRI
jgi:hypothetical protein